MNNLFKLAALLLLLSVFPSSVQAQHQLSLSSGSSSPGSTTQLSVLLDNQGPEIQGWSLSLCHDASGLQLFSWGTIGTDTATVNGGAEPGFLTINQELDGLTMGVVIDLFGNQTLGLVTGFIVLDVEYEATGAVGDTPQVTFCTLGSPPVTTVVVVDGQSVPPETTPGQISIVSPNWLIFGEATGIVGHPVDFPLLATTTQAMDGFQIAGNYDPTILTLTGATAGSASLGAEFVSIQQTAAAGEIVAGLVMSFQQLVSIPVGTKLHILDLQFDIDAAAVAPSVTQIVFVPSAGSPPVGNSVVFGQYQEQPNLVDGTMNIVNFNPFLRGDCNTDTLVDIADGISILSYLFQGSATPTCRDACDLNDDGSIDTSDAIYTFSYQFVAGAPPMAPFPDAGFDPTTGDGIGCNGDADEL